MNRINKIINHPLYTEYLAKIRQWEVERIFCGHDMTHFMDVARLAYIINLEENLGLNKEYIYATALLHDIGRFLEYENDERHEVASARLCKPILQDCGFTASEIKEISIAISNHRNKEIKDEPSLSGVIYRGDKASRPCHSCLVEDKCHWDSNKKNLSLKL